MVRPFVLRTFVRDPNNSSRSFQNRLETICFGLRESLNSIEGRLKAEHFKQRVLHVFRVWEEWAVYPSDQLVSLQYIFLGLITKVSAPLVFLTILFLCMIHRKGTGQGQETVMTWTAFHLRMWMACHSKNRMPALSAMMAFPMRSA